MKLNDEKPGGSPSRSALAEEIEKALQEFLQGGPDTMSISINKEGQLVVAPLKRGNTFCTLFLCMAASAIAGKQLLSEITAAGGYVGDLAAIIQECSRLAQQAAAASRAQPRDGAGGV